jgi:hypothetical protein
VKHLQSGMDCTGQVECKEFFQLTNLWGDYTGKFIVAKIKSELADSSIGISTSAVGISPLKLLFDMSR